jgi:hypothetical protein
MPEPGPFSKRPRSFFAISLGINVLVEVIVAKVKTQYKPAPKPAPALKRHENSLLD